MSTSLKISPCLWFDDRAEDAARFYVSVFADSSIDDIAHYSSEGFEVHGHPEGKVMTVKFTLGGQPFLALNGGPQFTFSEAISFQVFCDTQDEVDHYWNALTDGGEEGQCGWLKDRFGLSWQVVPNRVAIWLGDHKSGGAERVTRAFMQMKKLDIATLERAFTGEAV
ncbi:MAG: VOC family protein [Pseudomonadota bacterium]